MGRKKRRCGRSRRTSKLSKTAAAASDSGKPKAPKNVAPTIKVKLFCKEYGNPRVAASGGV